MGLLDRLLGKSGEGNVLWLYVRCGKCGAKVRVRINLLNDLSMDDEGGYVLRKDVMDSRCFQLMRAELHFDERRNVVSREIEGGEFISAEEYGGRNE